MAWKCDSCQSESSSRSDIEQSDRIIELIEKLRHDMRQEFVGIKECVSEVKKSLGSVQAKLDTLTKENEERREEYSKIAQENIQLKEEVGELRNRVMDQEQYSRRDNLEIHGVPYTNGEDLYLIMSKIAARIDVPFDPTDVSTLHRMPQTRRGPHPPIIARFVRRCIKDRWISSSKKKQRRLTAAELHDSFESTFVFINEHLTAGNKAILGRARQMRREKRLAFVWTKDGRVLVRKTAEGPVTYVRTLEDLEKLL